jgi:sugar lactone lactonase YvrE
MIAKHTSLSVLALAVVLVACSKDKPSEVTTTAAQPTGTTMAGGTTKPAETARAPATPPAPSMGKPVLTFKDGLNTPESVLYDQATDEYIVSNIAGDPLAHDGNGYIAKLAPDGKVIEAKWIEGKKKGVTLNAPKGLAIAGDKLYVGDIDTVRIFDEKTGAPAGEVKIPGGTFVNDLAVAHDGRVLVSDSGLRSGKQAMEPSGSDAVYAIDKDKKLTTIAKGKELGGPNGLLPRADKTWVVGFQSGELYSLDAKGKRADVQKLPNGSLDGIVALPSGDLLVSSWDASGVFRGKPGGSFEVVLEGVKAPADIGYDTKRGRLLVPLFNDNEIRVYDVK